MDDSEYHEQYRNKRSESATFSRASNIDALLDVYVSSLSDQDPECEPVQHSIIVTASQFLRALPDYLESPTITAEQDGHINFEWYRRPRNVLSISIAPGCQLYWSALIGNDEPRGSELFLGEVPQPVLRSIERVIDGKEVT